MVKDEPVGAADDLAEVWRALQSSVAQARISIGTPSEGSLETAGTGEVRELRRAVEALHRAVVALAERTTAAERELAAWRSARREETSHITEEGPRNEAIVDETTGATGRPFDRARPHRGYGRDS